MEETIRKCRDLANIILSNKDSLVNILLVYESFEVAEDEIIRSVDCLNNIQRELGHIYGSHVGVISVFMPVNQPLYSLILFGVIPSFMTDNVYIRLPLVARETTTNIFKLLDLALSFSNITILNLERAIFLDGCVSISDIVIFTGTHKNSQIVMEACGENSLFIYNGAGLNPIIVDRESDIDFAVFKTIQVRIFNSGQDCAGPDLILVHSFVAKKFLRKLKKQLAEIRVGDYEDKLVRVGRLVNIQNFVNIKKFFSKNLSSIIYGGTIDFFRRIISPTVIFSNFDGIKKKREFVEYFGPVFFISSFKKRSDIQNLFKKKFFRDFGMYVSIFGNIDYHLPKSVIILKNKNILDIENGNEAYGGFGKKANFVRYKTSSGIIYKYRPILISREIHDWLLFLKNN